MMLPVSLLAAVAMARRVLEDYDLASPGLADHGGFHSCPFHQRPADLGARAIAHQENLVELNLLADLVGQLFYFNAVAGTDPVLFSTRLDNCIHEGFPPTTERIPKQHARTSTSGGALPDPAAVLAKSNYTISLRFVKLQVQVGPHDRVGC